jgi:hypothetical protein
LLWWVDEEQGALLNIFENWSVELWKSNVIRLHWCSADSSLRRTTCFLIWTEIDEFDIWVKSLSSHTWKAVLEKWEFEPLRMMIFVCTIASKVYRDTLCGKTMIPWATLRSVQIDRVITVIHGLSINSRIVKLCVFAVSSMDWYTINWVNWD